MNIFRFVFQSRGLGNFARRTAQIAARFGHSPGKMRGRLERFMDVLEDYGVRPTFPVTALPMSRNPGFAHRLIERGAELAVHAWSHIDLTTLDYAGQSDHMGRAIRLFRAHAIPFTGFRAPYLRWNRETMRVVEDYKFRYSSNQTVWWDVIDVASLTPEQRDGLERGMNFYRPAPASTMRVLPVRRRGFVEIPVSLPDDEIPLDRMYM
ncbi:MAG: polysaccharide deacetylase family protein, partial [Candidatus Krumholzibacteriota bacterium]|nr:polysaccharide deacetylase family protein [Candidatus Krumholzibacteriota bacterium]